MVTVKDASYRNEFFAQGNETITLKNAWAILAKYICNFSLGEINIMVKLIYIVIRLLQEQEQKYVSKLKHIFLF